MRLQSMLPSALVVTVLCGSLWGSAAIAEDEKPIAIEAIERADAVDFEKEILPIFRRNCLACHNSTEAESDLILETPATILKGGGEGPAVTAGKSAESLLLKLASRKSRLCLPMTTRWAQILSHLANWV